MKVLVYGGGNMGLAYAKNFVDSNLVSSGDLVIIERGTKRQEELSVLVPGVRIQEKLTKDLPSPELVLLTIKPQDLNAAASDICSFMSSDCLLVSILAGVSLATLSRTFEEHSNILRCMPNLCVQVGRGVTICVAGEKASADLFQKARELLSRTGLVVEVEDEGLLNAATAISGSGPGYIFHIIDEYISSAINLGFEPEVARKMVLETISGSLEFLSLSNKSPAELTKDVTSKGGTTEAALNHWSENNFEQIFKDGVRKAMERAKELDG